MTSNNGEHRRALKRNFRTTAFSVIGSMTLAFAWAAATPAIAAELENDTTDSVPRGLPKVDAPATDATMSGVGDSSLQPLTQPEGLPDAHPAAGLGLRYAADAVGLLRGSDRLRNAGPYRHLAQFQLPETQPGTKPAAPPPELKFQYAYGSDSEITYRRNPDLNNRVRDNSTIAAPTAFVLATYRPNAWLEATMEMTLERQIAIQEEKQVLLPNGEIQRADKKRFSLLVDQAYLRIHNVTGPFEISVGRKNFEDARLWLYDAALDSVSVRFKQGNLQTDLSMGRENLRDLDFLSTMPRGHTDYYILHSEYRGIEDHRFAAYAITLRNGVVSEGKPLITGMRAYGRPTDKFNYWTEFALLRGEDPTKIDYRAHAFDVGATYRFTDVPTQPSVTLGYAYGSGDANPNDRRNREFRQTGLQSNEGRFGGVTQFKTYGETFDPELSNLKIFTLGLGFRPASNAFVDVVYHKYRLDKIGNDLRGSALTALVSQDDTRMSKRVGSEIDLILGFRNLFGIKRFGFEVRAGMFFPGEAYRVEEGDPNNPTFRKADKAVSVLAVFIY